MRLSYRIVFFQQDFSTPGLKNVYGISPSEKNYIVPGKRMMSSMAPSIIVNPNGHVSMVVGSAGGSRITTAIAYTIIQHYYMKSNASLSELFAAKRLHHQLLPNVIEYEPDFDQKIIDGLAALNHTMSKFTETFGFGALVGVYADDDTRKLSAAFDPRRGGSVYVF